MKKQSLLLLYTCILFAGCKKEEHTPVNAPGDKPDVIKNVSVTSLPGAARITYTLPDNKDVLYVKALYKIRNNETREIRSSYYNNFLITDGFGDTTEHTITLYAVTRGEAQSDAVTTVVKPLSPPVLLVARTLKIRADFGGVNIAFNNESKADIAIVALSNDSSGIYGTADVHYTNRESDSYSLRGYAAEKRKFGFYIRDRWGNQSDTLTVELTPLYEKLLDKTKFREVKLPGDVDYGWGLPISNIWNNALWHSADKLTGMPMWITFDLGVTAQLSRIGLWQRPNEWIYLQNNVRQFEIWGSTNPASDGSWGSWTKLIEHTVVKPSGLPVGQVNQADKDAAAAGEQMDVPLNAPKVRYIRVKILRTWTDGGYAANIQDMKFWGNDQ
ncbi:DUF5000 domain-containing lipoprotein [Chitinophaga silvatica]|nr:DUF5000 domain-containing lipoprotein [Chitinophaga silvatica]